MIHRGRIHLQGDHVVSPILRANISDFGAGACDQVVHTTGETGRALITRAKMLDDCNFCQFVSNEKQVRKYRYIFAT